MALSPAVLALSRSGEATARRLAEFLGAELHGREGRIGRADVWFPDAAEHVRTLFAAGRPIVGVCAAGILIRATAPLLSDKRREPPVIAAAEDASVVVPLLGGHRGANRLAMLMAEALGATAATTTAGEAAFGAALDEPPEGWALANPEAAKAAMAALLGGMPARLSGGEAAKARWLDGLPRADPGEKAVEILCAMDPCEDVPPGTLVYRPRRAVLGVGASRNCPPEEMEALASGLMEDAGLARESLAAVATAELKADEPAVLSLAEGLGLPLRLFDAAELEAETPRTSTPSGAVFAKVGAHGVAENAALACAGPDAWLLRAKVKSAMATSALAISPEPVAAPRGRQRGKLAVVGIGPGQASWRTPEASRLIAEADELVGYGLYIDLLGPLAAGKPRRDFPLGGEEDRCRYALERAGEGSNVALVCSGDAGIYAMAALVWELLDREPRAGGVSSGARRVEVATAPGVSALQAAAARAGAPLGHDFCAISLSDLLTPREDILRRLNAAAEGDFAVALYNPVSRRRRTLLTEARDIFLAHRPPHTPVLLGSSLGRPEERLDWRRLDSLESNDADMLTVVLVGSSRTRMVRTADGLRFYTPRGYAAKPRRTADG